MRPIPGSEVIVELDTLSRRGTYRGEQREVAANKVTAEKEDANKVA